MSSLDGLVPAINPQELFVLALRRSLPGEIYIFPKGVFISEQEAVIVKETLIEDNKETPIKEFAEDRLIILRLDVLFTQYRIFNKDFVIAVGA